MRATGKTAPVALIEGKTKTMRWRAPVWQQEDGSLKIGAAQVQRILGDRLIRVQGEDVDVVQLLDRELDAVLDAVGRVLEP